MLFRPVYVTESDGRAVALGLAELVRHDLRSGNPLLACLRRSCFGGDKAFDVDNSRARLRRLRAGVCIWPKTSRRFPSPVPFAADTSLEV
jgi:hypothetical protein